jgi:hypothetical protein
VSEPPEPDSPLPASDPVSGPAGTSASGDTEEVDAIVVAPAPRPLPGPREPRAAVPAVQAAAVAATGFVAGAAMVGLAHRRRRRRDLVRAAGRRRFGRSAGRGAAARGGSARSPGELLQIVGSRSLLVDVHLLGGRGD